MRTDCRDQIKADINAMTNLLPTGSPGYQLPPRLAAKLLFVALAYFVSGRLGLGIPYVGYHITLTWLPTGIAVAALLRWGYVCWPGIFLGALAVIFPLTPPRCWTAASRWAIR